jgi:iron complex outermembrane receptor protein
MLKNYLYILSFIITGLAQVCGQNIASSQTDGIFKDTVMTGEILVTANKIKMSPILAPNKIQIINNKMIAGLNGCKLSDLLGTADAVFIKNYGFNSGLQTISINSTQSEHALVLLNGVKLNSPQHGQFDASLLMLDNIERVEISTGGASSLYGSEAIGGVINIISGKNNFTKPLNIAVMNSTGSYGYNKLFLSGASRLKFSGSHVLDLSVSYANENSKNDYDYYYFDGLSNNLKNRGNSDFRTNSINIQSGYRFDKTSGIKLFSLYSYENRGVPGTDFGNSPVMARQIDDNIITNLCYDKIISNKTDITSGLSYKYSIMKYYDPLSYNTSSPINDFYKLNTITHNTDFNYHGNNLNITGGYEIDYNTILSDAVEKSRQADIGIYTAGKYDINNLLLNKITFYPSARIDYYNELNEKVVTGKFGINIKPFSKSDLSIKSSLANNYRAPTFNELYWIGLGNKDLKPEKSVGFDAGIFYDFKLFAFNKIEVSYFNTTTTDRIIWSPDKSGIWRPLNIGRVNSNGFDISFASKIKLFQTVSTGLTLNYNNAKSIKKSEDYQGDPGYNKQLIDIPQEYSKASYSLEFNPQQDVLKLISLNVFYTFTGKRFMDFENTRFTPYYDLLDANIMLNLNIFDVLTTFKFSVNNITNRDYEVISGYPMPLRNYNFQIGIKY